MSKNWYDDDFIPKPPTEDQAPPPPQDGQSYPAEPINEQMQEKLDKARKEFGLDEEDQEEDAQNTKDSKLGTSNRNESKNGKLDDNFYYKLQREEEFRLAHEEKDIEEYDDLQYGHDYVLTGKCIYGDYKLEKRPAKERPRLKQFRKLEEKGIPNEKESKRKIEKAKKASTIIEITKELPKKCSIIETILPAEKEEILPNEPLNKKEKKKKEKNIGMTTSKIVKESKEESKPPEICKELPEKCSIVGIILPGKKEIILPTEPISKKKMKKIREMVKNAKEPKKASKPLHIDEPPHVEEEFRKIADNQKVEIQPKSLDLNKLCNWTTTTPQICLPEKPRIVPKKKNKKEAKAKASGLPAPVKQPRNVKIPGCYREQLKLEELRIAKEEKDIVDTDDNLGKDFSLTKTCSRKFVGVL